MTRIEKLKEKVDSLYQKKNPDREDWSDWLYENHIFVVSDKAGEIAKRVGANVELSRASGMLHDIADAVMSRFKEEHEEKSLKIARDFLQDSEFSEEEIQIIVDDVLLLHSCRNGNVPNSLEGKVMATADAVVHFSSDFYKHAIEYKKKRKPTEDIKNWGLNKIEKDFNSKIFFDEVREETRGDYEKVKELFNTLSV